jgi:hypothetical protein
MEPPKEIFDSPVGPLCPPAAPNPSSDQYLIPALSSPRADVPSPPTDEEWNVEEMEPETAMKFLIRSAQTLAVATGDVPPTPPISRPTTPRGIENRHHHRRTSSRPATPIPANDIHSPDFKEVDVDSPEACSSEPTTGDVGENAQSPAVQQALLARKFFSKNPPAASVEEYVMRLHKYCPMSTAVYLAAGCYILKLCVEDRIVPVTPRTVHRLILGCLRAAMKALEDLAYPCMRFSRVGGVSQDQLHNLEVTVCYLLQFDLQVTTESLKQRTIRLQKAAHAATMATKLPNSFELRLRMPSRSRKVT